MAEEDGGTPRIAIVGGGPAGLVLARVLHRGGVRATVYERDAGPGARSQGGSLDLHPDTGQRALRAAGLLSQFRRHARPQGQEIRILDPGGHQHVHHCPRVAPEELVPDADGFVPGRPEIDRALLRRLLVDSLSAGVIRWGSHVIDIEPDPGGGYLLHHSDTATSRCDVLVGADGARSRVRALLTPTRPIPLGVTSWLMRLSLDDRPDLAELIGNGSLWCLGDSLNVGAQRDGMGNARVSVMLRTPGTTQAPAVSTKQDLLGLLVGWSSAIVDLVASAAPQIDCHEVAAMPLETAWPSTPGVTVIGDAAHLMPPVGEGANQAMLDGAELGRLLLAFPHDPTEAIRAAETAMVERVRPVAAESVRIQAAMVAPDALATMTAMFGGAAAR